MLLLQQILDQLYKYSIIIRPVDGTEYIDRTPCRRVRPTHKKKKKKKNVAGGGS